MPSGGSPSQTDPPELSSEAGAVGAGAAGAGAVKVGAVEAGAVAAGAAEPAVGAVATRLLAWFANVPRVTVAFSGGVDSAVVLAAAVRALGADHVTAATAVSPALPSGMLAEAAAVTASLGVGHREVPTAEMEVEGYTRNGHDRCYFCKATLVDALGTVLTGTPGELVVTGTNADDLSAGWRPGIRAAAERGAGTPLADTGTTKSQVRALARHWGLAVWDRPASPCLSSRVAYGVTITPTRLARVDRAEVSAREVLSAAGVTTRDLRVRDLGDEGARLEVDADVLGAAHRTGALAAVRDAGFGGTVTLGAFTSGALNAVLSDALRHA